MDLSKVMDYKTATCCYIGSDAYGLDCPHGGRCEEPALFEIIAVRATPDGDKTAGPDMYSDDTYACENHVGALLTFQPDAVERGNIYWHVRTLAPAMLSQ